MSISRLWFGAVEASAIVCFVLTSSVFASDYSIVVRHIQEGTCLMEVSPGVDAPNQVRVFLANFSQYSGRSFEVKRLCVRRSETQESCAAGMTEWTCCETDSEHESTCLIP